MKTEAKFEALLGELARLVEAFRAESAALAEPPPRMSYLVGYGKLFDLVTMEAARELEVDIEAIQSRTRDYESAHARQAAMYFCRRLTRASANEIGRYFHRNHATVAHGVVAIENRRATSAKAREMIDQLEKQIRAKLAREAGRNSKLLRRLA